MIPIRTFLPKDFIQNVKEPRSLIGAKTDLGFNLDSRRPPNEFGHRHRHGHDLVDKSVHRYFLRLRAAALRAARHWKAVSLIFLLFLFVLFSLKSYLVRLDDYMTLFWWNPYNLHANSFVIILCHAAHSCVP